MITIQLKKRLDIRESMKEIKRKIINLKYDMIYDYVEDTQSFSNILMSLLFLFKL